MADNAPDNEPSITLPGVGRVPRTAAIVAIVGILAVLGYVVYKQRKNAASTAVNAAAAQQAADIATTPDTTLQEGATGNSNVSVGSVNNQPSTNAEWTQAAASIMTTTYGYDGPTVLSALALYLNHQPLTNAQVDIVDIARGLVGDPPVGGPYPIITTGGNTGGTGGTSAPTSAPGGLFLRNATTSSVEVHWNAVPNAQFYQVAFRNNSNQQNAWQSAPQIAATSMTVGGLARHTNWEFIVRAGNGGGWGPYTHAVFANTV